MKKKIYDKKGKHHKEIELAFNTNYNEYVLTKRSVFDKSSQGSSLIFSEKEMEYLVELVAHK